MAVIAKTQDKSQGMVRAGSRIEGYDVARGLAILGMIIVHFKLIMGSSEAGPGALVFLTGLLEGRAAALFVILAGVGLTLLSRRAFRTGDPVVRRQARARILRRSGFLFVFGVLLATIWPADILHTYSVYFLIGMVLLFAPDRWLLVGAGAVAELFLLLFIVFSYETSWDWDALTYADFWTVPGFIRNTVFNGWNPVFPWTSFLLFGMWLGRQDVTDRQFRRRMTGYALVTLIVAEVASVLLIAVATPGLGEDVASALFSRNSIPPMPFFLLSAGSSAVIVIMLVMAIGEQARNRGWWRALVVIGQFALTLYVGHIIVGMGIIEELGWIDSGQSLWTAVVFSILFFLASIACSLLWRQHYQRGPFEALMRRLTD